MKEQIKKALESIKDDNSNWTISIFPCQVIFDIEKGLPLMVEAIAKIIGEANVQANVSGNEANQPKD